MTSALFHYSEFVSLGFSEPLVISTKFLILNNCTFPDMNLYYFQLFHQAAFISLVRLVRIKIIITYLRFKFPAD
jgi:hypothetical protein